MTGCIPRRPIIYVPNASTIDKALQQGNVLQYVQLHDLDQVSGRLPYGRGSDWSPYDRR